MRPEESELLLLDPLDCRLDVAVREDVCCCIEDSVILAVVFGVVVDTKNDLELCRRVLTTSSGHVTTAPTVPAVLLE